MPKMSTLAVKIKHNGKLYDVSLDPSQPATAFKQAIYERTGVPIDRQKVMVKGGMLKDEMDLAKIGARSGQTFMVIGSAGELPKAPTGPVTFLEDMTESQIAQATRAKAGLTNLGNTCYLNSTLQVLRCIPELQVALNAFEGSMGSIDSEANITASLRNLFKSMGETSDAFPPYAFLTILRQVAPQFAEQVQGGHGFAQQDAQEAWARIVMALHASLKGLSPPSASNQAGSTEAGGRFVDQYLTGRMSIRRSCLEAPDEEPTITEEPFTLLQCNISVQTNEMMTGILDSLNQQIQKDSPTLGRMAKYSETRRIDRLPAYLTAHFVRFYWRRDINKKTKIMRKVKFPFDLDVTPFLSEELQKKIGPANEKVKMIEKERDERAKIRRKIKARREEALQGDTVKPSEQVGLATATSGGSDAPRPAADMAAAAAGAALTHSEEVKLREEEQRQALEAIDPDLRGDVGANTNGLYELVGIVTHKGAAAEAGHYISWVRKEDDATDEAGGRATLDKPPQQEWYKFDDEKVSVVPREKIMTLDGGGEDSVAYILLYRSKRID
ncbi:cysteine proteinase [Acaromyces ingoldii]|uniref:Ubiquitin carboxyl-terminal hydrolase n=1 Tax=Acaromyces ingoldii TaxID=215250 RepID=A0A316YW55_9BASI|nr:cysteine proteinase [Acaromyces ingoldii]PWN92273.1 cysteine proteinase [Acaromyces ingoldii]